jgi:peptide chain release factor subunit 1
LGGWTFPVIRDAAVRQGRTGVADTITWEQLRELAGFRATADCAISLYVGLEPSDAPTAADVQARMASLLSEAGRKLEDAPTGKQEDLERIRTWLESGFDRSGLRGLAVFADGPDDLWLTIGTAEPLEDAVHVSDELYVAPLVPLVGSEADVLVAVVGREQGRVFRLQGGRLVEIADESEDVPGRHGQGGWSQGRFERHIDEIVDRHLRTVAEILDRCVRRRDSARVVLIGTDDIRAAFEPMVAHETRAAIVGRASAEAQAGEQKLLEVARPLLDEWREQEESELLDRWREEASTSGRASSGWEETLEAASDGRVDMLLVQSGAEHDAYECPKCGRAQTTNGSCPLDGTALESRDAGLDLAVHKTLMNGGTVQIIRDHRDLEPVGGLAALLRY